VEHPAAGGNGGGLVVAVRDRATVVHGTRVVERVAAAVGDPCRRPPPEAAEGIADALEEIGFDALLAEHRAAWAARWRDAEITIEGAPEDELAARFAVFHLLGAAAPGPEVAVGPRGLTGPAYGGHVFWDADVYVLPALAAIHPGAARAMLGYRTARLAAAQAEARQLGLPGARFPWESAATGTDVTPLFVQREGHLVEVLTDDHEEHVVADVAWAADRLVQWTGDEALAAGPVRQILQETARYWAGRLGSEPDPAHLRCVMGPDEYHARVDDDAFTNVMARWNLRRAADVAADPDEASHWRALADGLFDGWDPARGCHEQFAGYWDREPLLADQVADPPFAADLLLGAERVAGTQLIKQPDVLLLHHLVPHEVRPGSLAADLAVYDPRTVHGSSLSPAIHSALHARARRPERALEMFRIAARLDLDDLTGTTAGGLHLATMGGLWQALAHGFLGIEVGPRGVSVDPCLPDQWGALAMRMRHHGHRLGVRADHETVHVSCDVEVPLVVAGRAVTCRPPGTTVARHPRAEEDR
jgi:trehalose/maltose hydrolase-like predicted phosphorylase